MSQPSSNRTGNPETNPSRLSRFPSIPWFFLLPFILLVIFHKSLSDPQVIFSNDAPLGLTSSASCKMPDILSGFWQSLNWIGKGEGSALPSMSYGLLYLLGPVGYAKFGVPIALGFLGFSTMVLFRALGFAPMVQVVGGVACALNMSAFSSSAWGLLAWALLRGTTFLAIAALAAKNPKNSWVNAILAGFAVGMGVMDGADLGAFFSLYVAAFAFFLAFIPPAKTESEATSKDPAVFKGLIRLGVVTIAAAILAAHALQTLIGSQIKGIEGVGQDAASREKRWAEATQWSLPKIELVRVLIPGLFGYGMPGMYGIPEDGYGGANYWGRVGQSEGGTRDRLSGSGEYAGVFVILVALWGVAQGLRKNSRVIQPEERPHVLFWTAAALVSVLLAFGKHAPFYKMLYALPYFSTVRNPIKFMHPFQFSLIILFGYGLQAIWRQYAVGAIDSKSDRGVLDSVKSWYKTTEGFEKRFANGLLALIAASGAGWLIYSASSNDLRRHLKASFPEGMPDNFIQSIAAFSIADVGIYVVFLMLSVALLFLWMSGFFRGSRTGLGTLLVVGLLAVDLGRANAPWLIYFNYKERYASNPIIDFLRQSPHEHRVHAMLPFYPPDQQAAMAVQSFQQFYFLEWLQHRFQYYNIQALDVSQEPRLSTDKLKYISSFRTGDIRSQGRYWELTNTRYILGVNGAFVDLLNNQLDPEKRRFRIHTPFNLLQAPGDGRATAEPATNGTFALIEFGGALPRAKLYSTWETIANVEDHLKRIGDFSFDPHQSVLVAGDIAPSKGSTNLSGSTNNGTVEFELYQPKLVRLKAKTETESILLLNDRYDPHWTVTVNGQPGTILRCNYLVRGVKLPPGTYQVEYRYQPPAKTLSISLVAIACSLILAGWVALPNAGSRKPTADS